MGFQIDQGGFILLCEISRISSRDSSESISKDIGDLPGVLGLPKYMEGIGRRRATEIL